MSSLCWVFLHHPSSENLATVEAAHTYEKAQSRNISNVCVCGFFFSFSGSVCVPTSRGQEGRKRCDCMDVENVNRLHLLHERRWCSGHYGALTQLRCSEAGSRKAPRRY